MNGVLAFYEPDLVGREGWFTATRPGYAAEPDVFGCEGAACDIVEGGSGRIRMRQVGSPGACAPDDDATQLLAGPVPGPAELFRLTVVDAETGRGVPLAAVQWDGGVAVSDNAGEIALYDPDLVGAEVSFTVASHGYAPTSAVADLIGGDQLVVQLQRTMEAERLYRVEHPRIGRGPVGGHLGRPPGCIQRPGKEPSESRPDPASARRERR